MDLDFRKSVLNLEQEDKVKIRINVLSTRSRCLH